MQHDDFTCRTDDDDKPTALQPALLTSHHRRAVADDLNKPEESLFSYLNSSLGFIGTTVSLFYSAAASRL